MLFHRVVVLVHVGRVRDVGADRLQRCVQGSKNLEAYELLPRLLTAAVSLSVTITVKVVVVVLPVIRHTLDVALGRLPPVEPLPNKIVARNLLLSPPPPCPP